MAGWLGGGDGEGVGEHGGGVALVERGVLRPLVALLATRTAVVGGTAESATDPEASETEGEVGAGSVDDDGIGFATSSPVPSSWGRASSAPSIWVTCCSPVGTGAIGAATRTTDC